jgi:hypothetical protein
MQNRPLLERAQVPAKAAGTTPRTDGRPALDREPASCGCGFATDDSERAYNEEAFRYFLELESKRSEISNRPFLLLLVDLHKPSTGPVAIVPSSAREIFSALSVCVRETDFVGWYRTRSVVGAVLTQHQDPRSGCLQETASRRIEQLLRDRLSPELANQLQVRVYQVPPGKGMA